MSYWISFEKPTWLCGHEDNLKKLEIGQRRLDYMSDDDCPIKKDEDEIFEYKWRIEW